MASILVYCPRCYSTAYIATVSPLPVTFAIVALPVPTFFSSLTPIKLVNLA
jgi:hypothetical protein